MSLWVNTNPLPASSNHFGLCRIPVYFTRADATTPPSASVAASTQKLASKAKPPRGVQLTKHNARDLADHRRLLGVALPKVVSSRGLRSHYTFCIVRAR